MEDNQIQKGLRHKLIEELKNKWKYADISPDNVLRAMEAVPRHFFIDSAFYVHAYIDKAMPISQNQTMSQPSTVLLQSSLLDIKSGDKVLEIGTGSGYQTSILSAMYARVYSIERQKELYRTTKALLRKTAPGAQTFFGDGYKGLPDYAPFDKILVTCGAPFVPQALIEQLKIGGILVIPLGDEVQTMTKIQKKEDGTLDITTYGDFTFVPMLENKNYASR